MIAEHLNEALAYDTCSAEDSCLPLFGWTIRLHDLISIVLGWGIHTVPPCWCESEKLGRESGVAICEAVSERGEPMRVPRTWGLKVLRTQTTISVSAARGRTLAWSTFAPLAARAWASS
jgi:hypothetical protein